MKMTGSLGIASQPVEAGHMGHGNQGVEGRFVASDVPCPYCEDEMDMIVARAGEDLGRVTRVLAGGSRVVSIDWFPAGYRVYRCDPCDADFVSLPRDGTDA